MSRAFLSFPLLNWSFPFHTAPPNDPAFSGRRAMPGHLKTQRFSLSAAMRCLAAGFMASWWLRRAFLFPLSLLLHQHTDCAPSSFLLHLHADAVPIAHSLHPHRRLLAFRLGARVSATSRRI